MTKTRILALCALMSVSAVAMADGNAAAGKAKSAACAACHGKDGNSASGLYPKLAEQNERYLIKQMMDIKSGKRPIAVMTGQLDRMSKKDIADIAAYYASKSSTGGQADPALVEMGQRIYRAGIADRDVPACSACHSPSGKGNAPAGFPRLAGQHAEYTEQQLRSYRSAMDGDPSGRANDGEETKIMRMIAFGLSDREIKAVSTYIQGLH